jgi:hypothetical protein
MSAYNRSMLFFYRAPRRFAFGWSRFGSFLAAGRDVGPIDRLDFLGSWVSGGGASDLGFDPLLTIVTQFLFLSIHLAIFS